ncbi:MAG: hypothetical protein JNM56_04225 [Planctomycetia bacterium]|nr:hypothetical protein [Planctomycetia bacterium]
MRRSRTVFLGCALACCLPMLAWAAPPPGAPGGIIPKDSALDDWLNRHFGGPTGPKPDVAKAAKPAKPAEPKPARPAEKDEAEEATEQPLPTSSRPVNQVESAANERERELAELLRRQKVCLKLQEIALKNNDEDLMRKAEQLEERAREIYAERTAHLPCSEVTAFESDEKVLEKHLGPTSAATGSWTEPAVHQVPRVQPSSAAANREE